MSGRVLTYVSAVNYFADSPEMSWWKPDPLLNRTDADVTLMMLNQNAVDYSAPSDDPWMPAHKPIGSNWEADHALNLLACLDQYQICNPNKGNDPTACTKLSGEVPVTAELESPGNAVGLNKPQYWTVTRILPVALLMNMFNIVQGRGASALNGQ
jgi:hypothetical protein